jgi:signal transduction histidine kinase
VSTTAGAGVRVSLTRTGEHRDIPAAIDQSAFRIVQEALTNVVKHSGASTCKVAVGYARASLTVEITDPGGEGPGARQPLDAGANGTGHGILGMRERVSLCGGEFSAEPQPGRGFRVTAHFPLPAPPKPAPARQARPAEALPAEARPAEVLATRALPGQAR